MKLCLAKKFESNSGIEGDARNPVDELRRESGISRRLELPLEIFSLAVAAEEQISVETLEVAVDFLQRRDVLDTIDGGAVACCGDAGAGGAVKFLNFVVAI